MDRVFLNPGEIYFSTDEVIVETLLGSCIAITIFDKVKMIGGMIHYLLPSPSSNQKVTRFTENNYADFAIPNLLKHFKHHQSNRTDLEVKMLGGGAVIDVDLTKVANVGESNIKKARELLRKYGLTITGEDVGGMLGRKLQFNTRSGVIRHKKIERSLPKSETLQNDFYKIMVIDDSKPVRMVLKKIIESRSNYRVVAEAENPYEAMELRKNLKIDAITLDINMPKMDGVTYLKQYMSTDPVPTIMVTDYNFSDSGPVFLALENGALDYIKKPSLADLESMNLELFDRLEMAVKSNVKDSLKQKEQLKFVPRESITLPDVLLDAHILAVGASTGGTEAIKEFFVRLPENIPPTVVVQHMPAMFTAAFAERLNSLCKFKVREAKDGELLERGVALIAPGGKQMKCVAIDGKVRIKITDDPPVNRFKPSVDYLFNSLAEIKNRHFLSVILTGMGNDGAKGMLALKQKGAKTVAQDESSCVVFGMPKVAIESGAVLYVERLENISRRVIDILNKRS